MEFLRKMGRIIRRIVMTISDPPVLTFTNAAWRFGWLSSMAEKAVISVWRLVRGIIDIILSTIDIRRYYSSRY